MDDNFEDYCFQGEVSVRAGGWGTLILKLGSDEYTITRSQGNILSRALVECYEID